MNWKLGAVAALLVTSTARADMPPPQRPPEAACLGHVDGGGCVVNVAPNPDQDFVDGGAGYCTPGGVCDDSVPASSYADGGLNAPAGVTDCFCIVGCDTADRYYRCHSTFACLACLVPSTSTSSTTSSSGSSTGSSGTTGGTSTGASGSSTSATGTTGTTPPKSSGCAAVNGGWVLAVPLLFLRRRR